MISLFITAVVVFFPYQQHSDNLDSLAAEVLRHRLRINEMIMKADFTATDLLNLNQRFFSIETQLSNLQKTNLPNEILAKIQEDVRLLKLVKFIPQERDLQNEIFKLKDELAKIKEKKIAREKVRFEELLNAVKQETSRSFIVLSFKDSKISFEENFVNKKLIQSFRNSNIQIRLLNESKSFQVGKEIDTNEICSKFNVDAIICISLDPLDLDEYNWVVLGSVSPQAKDNSQGKAVLDNTTKRIFRR